MTRLTGNWAQYREAVDEAFTRNMHNPSVHWSPDRGFFATPDSRLIPMNDGEMEIGDAYYHANSGEQSMSGSRAEYRKVRLAQRLYFAGLSQSFSEAYALVVCAYDSDDQYSAYDPIGDLHIQLATAERVTP